MSETIENSEVVSDAVYDDGLLVLTLGVTHSTLAHARRKGILRFARAGKRVLYRGEWVLAWLERLAGDAESGAAQ